MGSLKWFCLCVLVVSLFLPIAGSGSAQTSWKYFEYPTETWIIAKQDYFGAFLEWSFVPVGGQAGDKRVWNFTWRLKDFVEVPINETYFEVIENPIPKIKAFLDNKTKMREIYDRLNASGIEGFDNFGNFTSDIRRLDRYPISILPEQRQFFIKKPVEFIDILNEKEGWFSFELKEWRLGVRIQIGFKSTITYSATTNMITAVGGSQTDPITFNDLHQADISGTRQLRAEQTFTGDAIIYLDEQPKPAEWGGVHLLFNVTQVGSDVWDIHIHGYSAEGSVLYEPMQLSGAVTGITRTERSFKNVTEIDVFQLTPGSNITFTILQDRWGVVSKTEGSTEQYALECRIKIGDGITYTYFADKSVQVLFKDTAISANGQYLFDTDYAQVIFGELADATDKTTQNGVQILSDTYTYKAYLALIRGDVDFQVYGSYFWFNKTGGYAYFSTGVTIYETTIDGNHLRYGTGHDFYDVTLVRSGNGFFYMSGDLIDCKVTSGTYAFGSRDAYGISLKGLVSRNTNYIGIMYNTNANVTLTDTDTDTWNIQWLGTNVAWLLRKYTFNLNITKQDGTPIQNANVTIYKYGLGFQKIGSWLTYANGSIPTQTLTMGFYNQTGGNTLYDYNPYNITITHPDYARKTFNWTLDKPIDWTITLEEPVDTFDYVTPILMLAGFPLGVAAILVFAYKIKKVKVQAIED